MDRGYVKLWRKITDSQIFRNEGLLKMWIWCLTKATHKKRWVTIKTGRSETEVELLPGQFVFGRDSAAKELNMNPSTVWKRMQKLKKVRNLTIESNSNCSIVSIMNWDTYQGDISKGDSEGDSRVTAEEQPSDTNKNVKNVKNVKKKDVVYPDWLDKTLWKEYLKYRTKIKKPMTDHAEQLSLTALTKLVDDGDDQEAVINKTINSGKWTSFYAVNSKGTDGSYASLPRNEDGETEFGRSLREEENENQPTH